MLKCTKENPMPASRDQVGQKWFHVDAQRKDGEPIPRKEGESCIYKCPNCGEEFRVTAKRWIDRLALIKGRQNAS